MPRPRPRVQLREHTLVTTDDGSRTLFSKEAGESYHSESGAAAEAEHVFVQLSGAAKRLETDGRTLRILEIGFGTGLNFLLTATRLRSASTLYYEAIEATPVPRDVFEQLGMDAVVGDPQLIRRVAETLERVAEARRKPVEEQISADIVLKLHIADATAVEAGRRQFDIVYHDAFSPSASPRLWEPAFLQKLFDALQPRGCLVTYCVRSAVQRALRDAGFVVEKHRGPPGGKREVLRAVKDG